MPEPAAEPTYTLYRRGMELLEEGDYMDAAAPLAEAARREPEKTSVREALGRALSMTGDKRRARHHLALASNLRPDRRDYRYYRRLLDS